MALAIKASDDTTDLLPRFKSFLDGLPDEETPPLVDAREFIERLIDL